MLGFPIRTPPDHSLVANSPGLIAGSNVLHRLLMPRHPPCALHSLSQQRQDNTHEETHQPTPQSKRQAAHNYDATGKERAGHANATTPTTHPWDKPIRADDEQATKMLASTMQISNNNPTNTPTHPKARESKGRNRSPTTHHHSHQGEPQPEQQHDG